MGVQVQGGYATRPVRPHVVVFCLFLTHPPTLFLPLPPPPSHSLLSSYDDYATNLSTPAAAALLAAQRPALLTLFQAALAADPLPPGARRRGVTSSSASSSRRGATTSPPRSRASSRPVSSNAKGGARGDGAGRLSLHGFLALLQERAALPQLVQPGDVAEVLKRLDGAGRPLVRVWGMGGGGGEKRQRCSVVGVLEG